MKNILQHPPRSAMSDDDEDHGRTAKRLEDDFSGADGTPRKRMKMGMTGAMSTEGFRTGGLAGTVWSKEVSVSMQARGYVSMASGGAGNGSIAQLLGPPPTSIAPMSSPQTSGSESVIMPHRSVSDSAARQQRSRQKKMALRLQRQGRRILHSPKRSPLKAVRSPLKPVKKMNWTTKVEIRMLLASVSVNVRKHFEDLGRQPTRHELDANSGGGNTMPDDLFYAALAAEVNDPSFVAELGFEDGHLGPLNGARTTFPAHGTWTAGVLKTKWRAGQAQYERVKQHLNRSGNQNKSCYCKCGGEGFFCSSGYNPEKHSGSAWDNLLQNTDDGEVSHGAPNLAVYAWEALSQQDPLFNDKGIRLMKDGVRYSGSVNGNRSGNGARCESGASKAARIVRKALSPTSTTEKEAKLLLRVSKRQKQEKAQHSKRKHQQQISKASTFMPTGHSRKLGLGDHLMAGIQEALNGPVVSLVSQCTNELSVLQTHLGVLTSNHLSNQVLLRNAEKQVHDTYIHFAS